MSHDEYHSEVCLLHVLFDLWTVASLMIDEGDIRYDKGLEMFLFDCDKELDGIFDTLSQSIKKSLSHECKRVIIEECNPNETLLYVINENKC